MFLVQRPEARAGLAVAAGLCILLVLWNGAPWSAGRVRAAGAASRADVVAVDELLAAVVAATQAAGAEVVAVAASQRLGTRLKQGGQSSGPVTSADLRSDATLVSRLRSTFPFVRLVSEEENERQQDAAAPVRARGSSGATSAPSGKNVLGATLPRMEVATSSVRVWLDPLDATKEFTQGLNQYVSVMGCVAVDGRPAAGVIHFPFLGKTLWGVSPELAGARGRGIVGTKPAPPPPAAAVPGRPLRFVVSRSHTGKAGASVEELGALDVVEAGGSGFKVAELLEGRADAYVHTSPIMKWDLCAGDALLRASDGALTGLGGEDVDYADVSSPRVTTGVLAALYGHADLVARARKASLAPSSS